MARRRREQARGGPQRGAPQATPESGAPRGSYWPDAAFVVVLLAAWAWYVAPIVILEQRHGYDLLRDVASVRNILEGRWLADPTTRGETIWYPPLSPLIVAAICAAGGADPLDVYRFSGLLVNWLIPLGLFVAVRVAWGRTAAIVATVALLLAMPWWQSFVLMAAPFWHGVAWGWLTLAAYVLADERRSWKWAAACAAMQLAAFLHHPIVPLLLMAVVMLRRTALLWSAWRDASTNTTRAAAGRDALAMLAPLAAAAPALLWIQRGPILNPLPRWYFASELRTVEFALLGAHPWLWGLGLIGLVLCIARRSRASSMVLSVLLVTTLAQLSAYGRVYGGEAFRWLPVLLPHEFQALWQLAWAICIGVAAGAGIDRLSTALAGDRARTALQLALLAACVLITGLRGYLELPQRLRRDQGVFAWPAGYAAAAKWITDNTRLDDVFLCDKQFGYLWLNARTGRKLWLAPIGHTNPRVDWRARARLFDALDAAPTAEAFHALALRCGIDYVVVSPEWVPYVLSDAGPAESVVPGFLQIVFRSGDGLVILRVNR